MLSRRVLLSLPLAATLPLARAQTLPFNLRFDLLSPALGTLSKPDRIKLDTAINLIRRGEHLAAFAPLTDITKSNPKNGSVRVILAYTMLQLGNLAGAFDHANKAEKHAESSYVCAFLARVAALTGKPQVCERELKHISADPAMAAEAKEIRTQLSSYQQKRK
jgi:Flp pilus assembly protein TadD